MLLWLVLRVVLADVFFADWVEPEHVDLALGALRRLGVSTKLLVSEVGNCVDSTQQNATGRLAYKNQRTISNNAIIYYTHQC